MDNCEAVEYGPNHNTSSESKLFERRDHFQFLLCLKPDIKLDIKKSPLNVYISDRKLN